MKGDLVFTRARGSAAIAARFVSERRYRLLRVAAHFSAAPTTSENLTIYSRPRRGYSDYDTLLYERDLSVGSVTDLVVPFGEGYEFDSEDEVDIDYANTDAGTYGLRIVTELLED